MKYFTGPIVSLNVFRLIERCTVSAEVETSTHLPTDRVTVFSPRNLSRSSFYFRTTGGKKESVDPGRFEPDYLHTCDIHVTLSRETSVTYT